MKRKQIVITSNTLEQQIPEYFELTEQDKTIEVSLDIHSQKEIETLNSISHSIEQCLFIEDLSIIFQKYCILENMPILANGISKLRNLTRISIEFQKSCFVGEQGVKSLADALKKLDRLIDLKICFLKHNSINTQSVNHIRDCLKSLPLLQKISIQICQSNGFSNDSLEILSEGIGSCENLAELTLNLDFQNVNHTGLSALGQALQRIPTLSLFYINFDCNQDLLIGIHQICDSISNQVQLKQLALTSSHTQKLESKDIESLQNCLDSLLNLEELSFYGLFSHYQYYYQFIILKSLKNQSNLQKLKLQVDNFNLINEEELKIIGINFQRFNELSHLTLNLYNESNINDQFLYQISKCFQRFSKLQQLDLKFLLRVDSYQSTYFFSEMRHLKHLNTLKMEVTEQFTLRKKQLVSFSESVKCMTELKCLDLVLLTQELDLNFFFDCFQYLKQLESLTFKYDQIMNSKKLNSFVDNLESLQNLKILDLKISFGEDVEDQTLITLSSALRNMKFLSELNFHQLGQFIENEEIQLNFFNSLGELIQLKKLLLTLNMGLSLKSSESFGNTLSQLINLESCELKFFGESSLIQIYTVLKGFKSQNLKKLDLSFTSQQQEDEYQKQQFVDMFESIQSLESFKINIPMYSVNNDIYEIFFESLNIIKKLQSLEIDFGYCSNITKNGFTAIKQLLSQQQSNLIHLDLSFGSKCEEEIIEDGINTLYEGISCLQTIRIINLNIHFDDERSQHLIDSFNQLKNLRKYFIFTKFINQNRKKIVSDQDNKEKQQKLEKKQSNISMIEIKPKDSSKYLTQVELDFQLPNEKNNNKYISLFKQLRYSKYLRKFRLKTYVDFEMKDEYFQELGYSLQQLQNIDNIDLILRSFCNLSKNSLIEFSKGILNQKSLSTFGLYQKGFQNSQFESSIILEPLKYLSNLQNLSIKISENETFSDETLVIFGEGLSHLYNLRSFFLDISKMQKKQQNFSKGIEAIGNALSSTTKLERFTFIMGDNQIIGQKAGISLGKGLCHLKELQCFILTIGEEGQISNEAGQEIARSLSQMRKLNNISIIIDQNNNLQADLMREFSVSIYNHQFLRSVSIQLAVDDNLSESPFVVEQLLKSKKEEVCQLILNNYDSIYQCMFYHQSDIFDIILTLQIKNEQFLENDMILLISGFTYLPTNFNIKFTIDRNCGFDQTMLEIMAQQFELLNTKKFELYIDSSNELQYCIQSLFKELLNIKNLKELSLCLNNCEIPFEQIYSCTKIINQSEDIMKIQFELSQSYDMTVHQYQEIFKEFCKMKYLRQFSFHNQNSQILSENNFFRQICKIQPRFIALDV